MPSSAKLLFVVDPAVLRADLDQISSTPWVPHFNDAYFEGEWSGVALRSGGGLTNQLYADPRMVGQPFEDTPVLDSCPNIRIALERLRCPVKSVRFLKLAPGSTIQEHRDYDLGFDFNQIRLHIPIITNPEVVFFLDAQQVEMKAGECWYLDLSLPHWVENHGKIDRIHLVIDCELNDWLRQLILAGEDDFRNAPKQTDESREHTPGEFERFRKIVLSDLRLQQRLRMTADRESFVKLAVTTGREVGCAFDAADVESAIENARKAWYGIWVQ